MPWYIIQVKTNHENVAIRSINRVDCYFCAHFQGTQKNQIHCNHQQPANLL